MNIYNVVMQQNANQMRQNHKKTRAISGSSGHKNNENPIALSSQAQLSQVNPQGKKTKQIVQNQAPQNS